MDTHLPQAIRDLSKFKKTGDHQWIAACPAHEDKEPSLSIGLGSDWEILLFCHAGCAADAICDALGIRVADLFCSDSTKTLRSGDLPPPPKKSPPGAPLPAEKAQATMLRKGYALAATFPYGDRLQKLRWEHPTVGKSFQWEYRATAGARWISGQGSQPVPLFANEVFRNTDMLAYAVGTEGEQKVLELGKFGIPAFSFRELRTAEQCIALHDIETVLWPDKDAPGTLLAENAASLLARCGARGVRMIEPPEELPEKGDVLDGMRLGWDEVKIRAIIDGAPEWTPPAAEGEAEELESIQAESRVAEAALPYVSPCPPDHFLSRWIEYCSARTDAVPEFHEAGALVLLAAATPNVRARLAPYPRGLPTNLYALMIGDSTTSRKSTSQGFARDVQVSAMSASLCADHFSPEGFIEQLASRNRDCTTLYVDEFGELLTKIHHAKHMAGLRGLLLTVYAGDDYTYRRHSKNNKGVKIEDVDHIERPHLSILGATTPALFDSLEEQDVISGLLPRFAVIMPRRSTVRRPFFATSSGTDAVRAELIAWICRLHEWALDGENRVVVFEDGVLECIDAYAIEVETECSKPVLNPRDRAMLQRLIPMAVKLSMLVAAGKPGIPIGPITLRVTTEDAGAAVTIARRWQGDALRFASRIGESHFERTLQRCLKIVHQSRSVRRRTVARAAHIEKKMLDAVRDTLLDRALISVVKEDSKSGPSTELWKIKDLA